MPAIVPIKSSINTPCHHARVCMTRFQLGLAARQDPRCARLCVRRASRAVRRAPCDVRRSPCTRRPAMRSICIPLRGEAREVRATP